MQEAIESETVSKPPPPPVSSPNVAAVLCGPSTGVDLATVDEEFAKLMKMNDEDI